MQKTLLNITQLSKHSSEVFWCLKGFAIFTVFFAHMPAHKVEGLMNMPYVYDVIGMWGVPLFLMIAGFFDYTSKTPSIIRARKLFVPLLIWGTITFLIHILRNPEETHLKDYLMWIYGCGSWLYFVPVLFWCQLLLKSLGKEWIWIISGLVSTSLTVLNIIPYNMLFTPYVNPFNFIIYFCVGRLLRKYNVIDFISKRPLLWMFVTIVIMTVFLFITKPQYWTPWTWIFSMSLFVFLFLFFTRYTWMWLIQVGMISYVIYLCHIQIAGFVHFRFSFLWGTPFEIVKVFVAFVVVCLFCSLLKYSLVKFGLEKELKYLGFR